MKGRYADDGDPAVHNYRLDPVEGDRAEFGLDFEEGTREFQRRVSGSGHRWKIPMDRETLGKIITRKRFLSLHKEPELLTFTERSSIKLLYKSDPQEWTVEKLAESFPATEAVVQKVVRKCDSLAKMLPSQIEEMDERVRENWIKLKNGEFDDGQISDEYKQHLLQGWISLEERVSGEAMKQMKKDIVDNHVQQPPPAAKGPFAAIIVDYNKKAGANRRQEALPAIEGGKVVVEVKDNQLMSAEDDLDNWTLNRRPEGGTSLLNVKGIHPQLRRSGQISMDEFRKKFLAKFAESQAKSGNPAAAAYLEWLRKEFKHLDEGKGRPKAFGLKEVMEEEAKEPDFHAIKKYKQVDEVEEEVVERNPFEIKENVKDIPPTIVVPETLKSSGRKIHQQGDCFYDENGDFLHRIPQR